MSFSQQQPGVLCRRGLAVCLVGMLSLTLWQSSVEATCGDYLSSHGEMDRGTATLQHPIDLLVHRQLPVVPRGCPHGECRSPDEAPEPVGSNSDHRIVDDVRSFGWLDGRKSQSRDSSGRGRRPVDERRPESPLVAGLERPPQSPSVATF